MNTKLIETLQSSDTVTVVLPAKLIPPGSRVTKVVEHGCEYIIEHEIIVYSETGVKHTLTGLFLTNPRCTSTIFSVDPDKLLFVKISWEDLAEIANERE